MQFNWCKYKPYLTVFAFTQLFYFVLWFVIYNTGLNSQGIQSEDVVPASVQPYAIINDQSLYLDSYYDDMLSRYPHPDDKDFEKGLTPYYLYKSTHLNNKSSYMTAFTFTPGILATPIYYLFDNTSAFNWDQLIVLSHIASSVIMGLTTIMFLHLLLKYFELSAKQCLLLTFVFAFCTLNFSMFSQALWQHGVVELFTIGALLFIFKNQVNHHFLNLIWAGVFLGLAFITRPTALLIVFYLSLLTAAQFEPMLEAIKKLIPLALGFFISVFVNMYLTLITTGGLFNSGYSSQLSTWYSKFPEGFLGMWLSPSKGILVYSPVFIFSLIGLYLAIKSYKLDKEKNFKYLVFGMIVLVHTLILSIWKHWYGGYSFGYRMAGEVIPFLVLLLIPYIKSEFYLKTAKYFILSIVLSFSIHLSGLVFYDGIWHNAYDKGYINTSWLWSIKDSEFAFNIRRVMVKLDLLDQACPVCLPKD